MDRGEGTVFLIESQVMYVNIAPSGGGAQLPSPYAQPGLGELPPEIGVRKGRK